MSQAARVPEISTTGTGDAQGYLTVASNAGIYPGAKGWLSLSNNTLQQYVMVTELSGTTKVGLRFLPESADDPKLRDTTSGVRHPNFGRNNLAAYLAGSKLYLPAQVVPVYQPIIDPLGFSEI